MALKGDLRDFPVTSLFNLVNLAGKTGLLVIETRGRVAKVYFKEGKLVQAVVGDQGGDLTALMLKGGKITPEQANLVRQRARTQTDKELGLLLIGSGYCNQRDIVQVVKTSMLENVYPLFTWTEGSFYFDASIVPPHDQITIMLNLENIIIEGTRWIKEWGQLQDDLPTLDVALKFVEKPDGLPKVQLTVEEWRTLSFISPKNTVRQIARACNMDEFQIRKTVYRLLQAGLVEVVKFEIKPPPLPPQPQPPPQRGAASPQAQALATPAPAKIDRGLIHRLIQKVRSIGV